GDVLDWEKRGWPNWAIYQPVLEAALESGLKVVAGNIDRKITRNVALRGFDAVEDAKAWGLDGELPKELADALDNVLMEGHCNLLPESALPAMRKVQRARDASLADAMLAASDKDGAILVTGSGHVRADFAVPYYLTARSAGDDWLAVQFVPVGDEEADPEKYLQHKSIDPAKTISIFTPRVDDKDHCAELREHMSKKKKKGDG
ncbi:MAG: ChaN family lipoprotein, partial [Hyphomicrobiales bacterium]